MRRMAWLAAEVAMAEPDREQAALRVVLALPPAVAALEPAELELARAQLREMVARAVTDHLAAVRAALVGVQGAERVVPALELVELV